MRKQSDKVYMDGQKQVIKRLVEEFNWNPSIEIKSKNNSQKINFPIIFTPESLEQNTHMVGLWRHSPTHRNLPEVNADDSNAIDFFCPPGLKVVAPQDGIIIDKNLSSQLAGNNRDYVNDDNRVYAQFRLGNQNYVWCVRHLAPRPENEVINLEKKLEYNNNYIFANDELGTTGYSGYYASKKAPCHIHFAVYEINNHKNKPFFQSLPIKLA